MGDDDTTDATASDAPRQRYKMTIAYDGTLFHGWQKQLPPDGIELRTVAGVVESTLKRVLKQRIELVGASRTDAGVHARGQVAHFDATPLIPTERMVHAINSRLPEDIDVRSIEDAPATFDAIFGAVRKQYRYRIFNASRRPLDRRHHVWHCWWDLNLDKMRDAAARCVGTHDFEGFAAAGHGRASTVRTIFFCDVEREGDDVTIVVEGDGFLYNMVRILSGTLVEVGRGAFEPDMIDTILTTHDRRHAGPTLPPTGLWLQWIRYDSDAWEGVAR